ncbi:M48 family metalloprotease [Rhodobaculum claviforme]|nr:M48 family metalloprotease [Rhodobaculum claviforme]
MRRLILVLPFILAACVVVGPPPTTQPPPQQTVTAQPRLDSATAAANFERVVNRMEPVVTQECRARAPGRRCDFLVVVDTSPGLPPNAFQTLDRDGRPVIGFTLALLADARNVDELAFIFGHEAGHHIAGHIPRRTEQARTGALIAGALAALTGADDITVERVAGIGGEIAARRFAPAFELEADEMGTVLAWRAGFDPERGAQFFSRIPDPGNAFLATHPPNAQRQGVVRDTMARLRAGGRV